MQIMQFIWFFEKLLSLESKIYWGFYIYFLFSGLGEADDEVLQLSHCTSCTGYGG